MEKNETISREKVNIKYKPPEGNMPRKQNHHHVVFTSIPGRETNKEHADECKETWMLQTS